MNQKDREPPPSQGSGGLDDWALPAQPASGGNGDGKRDGGNNKLFAAWTAVVILALISGVTVFFATGGNKSIAAMSYVSVDDPGPNPFMQSTTDKQVSTLVSSKAFAAAESSGAVDGTDPNLYGGSGELSVCDVNALVSNLKQDSKLKAAFAAGIGIKAADVERYVLSLKSVVLRQDTWVTNHGYSDGKPTPYQAVLQRGTAVMVDSWGVPRVRCSCGNPLAEAWNGYTAPSNAGSSWDGYDSAKVATVYGGDEPSNVLWVADLSTGTKEKVRLGDAELQTQVDAVSSVTADTPRTMPKDMGVKPDEKLLDELGIPVAKYDEKQRPTGGERFNEKVGGADGSVPTGAGGPNFPTWKSQTTMVDAEQFRVGSSDDRTQYMIHISEKDVSCEVMTKGGDDNIEFVICRFYPRDTGFFNLKDMKVSAKADPEWRHNSVQYNGPESAGEFKGTFYPAFNHGGSPLEIRKDLQPGRLEPGESVQVGNLACFNLADKVGCELPDSKFFSELNDGLFFDGSPEAYGTTCGTVGLERLSISVVLGSGYVDCDIAMAIGKKRIDSIAALEPSDEIYGWTCSSKASAEFGYIGRGMGTCVHYSTKAVIAFQ